MNLSKPIRLGIGASILVPVIAVAWRHAQSATPSLEEMMVVWLLSLIGLAAAAHAFGGLVQRWTGLAEIVGWLTLGIVLNNAPGVREVTRHVLHDPHYHLEHVLEVAGQLGVWLLLTKAGLETELGTLVKNAGRGTVVALIGVVVPGIIVYLFLPLLFPSMSPVGRALTAAIFTPTSLGVASLFFKGEGILKSGTAQLVMAVAAIDDIIGLLILTALQGSMTGSTDMAALGIIMLKAVIFFAASLSAGALLAPSLSRFAARLNGGEHMRLALALGSAVSFAWIAQGWGLSPLMGAYAGGVFLTEVHFREFESPKEEHGVEHLLRGIEYILVPLFVVSVALKVDLHLFLQPRPILLTVGGTLALILGKILAGRLAGPGNDRWTLVWGALVRGEVALVIASIGLNSRVIGPEIMSVAVMTMVASIVITSWLLPKAIVKARQRDATIFKDIGLPHEQAPLATHPA